MTTKDASSALLFLRSIEAWACSGTRSRKRSGDVSVNFSENIQNYVISSKKITGAPWASAGPQGAPEHPIGLYAVAIGQNN